MSVGLQIGALTYQPVSQLAPFSDNKEGGKLAGTCHF